MKTARVGLDVPLAQLFDYRVDDVDMSVGERVLVPFGRRRAVGVVLELADSSNIPADRLKSVSRVLREARLTADDLRLLRFAADYYHYPLGQVVMNALPQRLKRSASAAAGETQYAITQACANATPATVPPSGSMSPPQPPTPAQVRAIETIHSHLGRFEPSLLSGVTGSGKTEVYLRVAQAVLSRGAQVLMLVPEIALTPQLEAMVKTRFPDTPLASLHSGLNETERLGNWLAAHSGRARIVLGTRLAVFVPLPDLGLIVVDEEHDGSFKQTEGFCYSARDLAVVRGHQRGVPVVLGSATPALESYYNAASGRYALIELPERINERPPRIQCIPLQGTQAHEGLAPRLLEAIAQKLARREQSLIFINRRGYAPVLMCHSCGWLSGCHRCSAQLVLHLSARELHCHHCGHRARIPEACPSCGNPALSPIGQGTQRIEDALISHFPQAHVLRIDRDSVRRKRAWSEMRRRIRAREVDILVGTQMLAKGHDFPHLALVGVLNADCMLYSADFRASERLYALLTQVAGRAGRGETEGEVLIQTEFPDHPVYAALRAQDMHGFASRLLAERRASGFPPFVHQALLRAEAPQVATALQFLEEAKRIGREISVSVELYDAVPAAMVRLAGRERAQLLVQSASRPALHAFLRAWCARLATQKSNPARWALEVDPLEL